MLHVSRFPISSNYHALLSNPQHRAARLPVSKTLRMPAERERRVMSTETSSSTETFNPSSDAAHEETSNASSSADAFELIGPDPQRFTVAQGQFLKVLTAAAPFLFRLGYGAFGVGYSSGVGMDDGKYAVLKALGRKVSETSLTASFPRPKEPLVLYEFEGCPFCRKVREAVSMLDLDVLFYPCPKGGPTWRPQAVEKGGKSQFPYLVDPNTGTAMYESDDIINYLFNTYGDGQVPLGLRLGMLTTLSCGLALAASAGAGSRYRPSKLPDKPLILWAYEASPFCKIVREELNELELPHIQRTCVRGSSKRDELLEKRGIFQVPYLEDPNSGVALFESAAIVRYLEQTYAKA